MGNEWRENAAADCDQPVAMRPAAEAPGCVEPAWKRTLYVMFLAQLITAVGFSSIFPFLPLYVKDLGSSTGLSVDLLIGLVFSAQAFTMMLASPVWGALADRFGRKLMVERAMFGGSLILMGMAFVHSAEQLVLLRAVQGLVSGTIGASNALVAAVVPRERAGYAMGLLQTGMGVGVALGPLVGGVVADTHGYAAAFYLTSGLLFVAGIMVWLGAEEHFERLRGASGAAQSMCRRWRHALCASGVGVTYTLRFLNQMSRMLLLPVLPLFILQILQNDQGVNTFTGLVVGVTSATTTLSAVYLGRLGDRIGHRRILVVSTLVSSVLYAVQSGLSRGWQLLVLQAVAGIFLGGILPSITALLARYTESGEEGAVYGLDNAISSGARMVAPLAGMGIAACFGLRSVFLAAALLYALAAVLAARGLPESGWRME